MKFPVDRSQTSPGPATMLGDVSFLKFVAANQGFPGKAQGRAGCWRVSPLPGCPTSDESPGPKTKRLQDVPLKSKGRRHGEAEAAGLLLPLNEANHSEATRGAQNQPPGRPLVSIQKTHASGKQHAFPFLQFSL